VFTSLGNYRFEKDGAGYVLVSNGGGAGFVTVDAVQFLPEVATADEASANAGEAAEKRTSAANKTELKDAEGAKTGVQDASRHGLEAMQKRLTDLSAELKELEKKAPPRTTAMVVAEQSEIGDTAIRVRGIAKQKGAVVPRGVLRALNVPGFDSRQFDVQQSGRLKLAEWLVDPRNPLTARVLVNHVWAWVFGRGLVPTTENFGTTGEPPSHPELLDDLAIRFMEEGWSLKKLVRELVVSHAWRLREAHPDSKDPRNALWSRHVPRRLDADQIRDALLQASGRLQMGFLGPNMAGAGEINANDSGAQNVEYKYVFTDFRRSVYTPAFRNKRHEIFEAFDFGDINNPVGVRETSTVAPQALFFLNSAFVGEQALAMGELFAASGEPFENVLSRMARVVLSRELSADEHGALLVLYQQAPGYEAPAQKYARIAHALFGSIDFRYLR
jgi:hypothetical protein